MENDWILDSGASEHMLGDRSVFTSLTRHETPISITIASGDSLVSTHYGQVNLLNHFGEKVSFARVYLLKTSPSSHLCHPTHQTWALCQLHQGSLYLP